MLTSLHIDIPYFSLNFSSLMYELSRIRKLCGSDISFSFFTYILIFSVLINSNIATLTILLIDASYFILAICFYFSY